MLRIPNNLQNVDNTTYAYSEKFKLQYNPWIISLFQKMINEENHFAAIIPVQLNRLIKAHHQEFSEFINGCSGQVSFNGLITLTSSKTGEKLELVFKNFEQWSVFYQDFVSFKSNELSLQSVIDNHIQRVQESMKLESII